MVRDLAMSDATFAEIKKDLSNEHMTDLVLTIAFYCASCACSPPCRSTTSLTTRKC
jgi:hypothetical protein